jgi:anti-sigma B factor antagonist
MTKNFSRTDVGDETTLRIEAVLDAVTVPDIRPTIDELVTEQRRSIIVDLSSLRLIDSSGVGVIVSLYKRCKDYGGTVRVVGVKDQPLTIFRLLRLDRVFGVGDPRP